MGPVPIPPFSFDIRCLVPILAPPVSQDGTRAGPSLCSARELVTALPVLSPGTFCLDSKLSVFYSGQNGSIWYGRPTVKMSPRPFVR